MMVDVNRLRAACACTLVAIVTAPGHARGEGFRMALGAGVASRSLGSGIAYPFELTLQASPLLSVSAGAVAADGTVVHAYGEVAVNLIVSVGVGAGYQAATGFGSDAGLHLFFGLPIPVYPPTIFENPLGFLDEPWWGYLLPYYRPSWGPWPGVVHEMGVMLKVSRQITHHPSKIGG
jgi:hypothetical protein